MKLSILQENLLKVLQDAQRCVPSKPQIPILSCFLFQAHEGVLTVVATDLSSGVSLALGGKVEKEGECAVPARPFLEYISALPAGNLDLELEQTELRVRGVRSTTVFQTMSAKEFPPFKAPETKWNEVVVKDFVEMIDMGGVSASLDETRPVYASIMLEAGEDTLAAVSTDGYRLSKKTIHQKKWGGSNILVPAKALKEIVRIVAKTKQKSALVVSVEGTLWFKVDDGVFFIRLIEGNFPQYSAIVPSEFSHSILLEREELLETLKTVMVFSRESSGVVKWSIQAEELVLTASSQTLGTTEARVSLGKAEGGEASIAFNAKYVYDVLNGLEGETLRFQMNESLRPGMFTIESDPSYFYLVMPFRV